MRIVGFDISSKRTGICIIDPREKTVDINTLTRDTGKDATFKRLLHPYEMINNINAYVKEMNLTRHDLFVIEEYNIGRSKGRDVVPWVQGFVMGTLCDQGIILRNMPWYVNETAWKKCVTGRDTSEKKQGIEEACYQRCEELGFALNLRSQEDDSFDAFGIAYYRLVTRVHSISKGKSRTRGRKVKRKLF